MKRLQLHITLKQFLALMAKKKEDGLSLAEHIRRAIDEYLKDK